MSFITPAHARRCYPVQPQNANTLNGHTHSPRFMTSTDMRNKERRPEWCPFLTSCTYTHIYTHSLTRLIRINTELCSFFCPLYPAVNSVCNQTNTHSRFLFLRLLWWCQIKQRERICFFLSALSISLLHSFALMNDPKNIISCYEMKWKFCQKFLLNAERKINLIGEKPTLRRGENVLIQILLADLVYCSIRHMS